MVFGCGNTTAAAAETTMGVGACHHFCHRYATHAFSACVCLSVYYTAQHCKLCWLLHTRQDTAARASISAKNVLTCVNFPCAVDFSFDCVVARNRCRGRDNSDLAASASAVFDVVDKNEAYTHKHRHSCKDFARASNQDAPSSG